MRTVLAGVFVCLLPGCPKQSASAPLDMAQNLNPYKNVMPQKMKSDVEAAHQREADRDEKRFQDAAK